MNRGLGTDVKALLRRHRPDPDWASDLNEVRELLEIDEQWLPTIALTGRGGP